jgi:hypothetical protein
VRYGQIFLQTKDQGYAKTPRDGAYPVAHEIKDEIGIAATTSR